MRKPERALPIALLHAREATLRPFRKDLEAIGLTAQQWRVIRVLGESESRSASELSELCVLMPPSLSRILKKLSDLGLITRMDDRDRRKRRVRITAAGREKYDTMAVRAAGIYARLEASFGEEKMEQLLDLLSELRVAAKKA